jgi:hypothetical protein
MFCPLCKTEYREGFTRCADCGVDLVASRSGDNSADDLPELVWRGSDPVAFSRVIAALRAAGLSYQVTPRRDHLVFELAASRPRYDVRIRKSDFSQAQELVADIRETLPFQVAQGSQEIPESVAAEGSVHAQGEKWDQAGATVRVWAGGDAELARTLVDCLAENSIGVRADGKSPDRVELLVLAEDAERAREIVREVLEGSPPA